MLHVFSPFSLLLFVELNRYLALVGPFHQDVLGLLEKRVRSRFSQRTISFRHAMPFQLYVDISR